MEVLSLPCSGRGAAGVTSPKLRRSRVRRAGPALAQLPRGSASHVFSPLQVRPVLGLDVPGVPAVPVQQPLGAGELQHDAGDSAAAAAPAAGGYVGQGPQLCCHSTGTFLEGQSSWGWMQLGLDGARQRFWRKVFLCSTCICVSGSAASRDNELGQPLLRREGDVVVSLENRS